MDIFEKIKDTDDLYNLVIDLAPDSIVILDGQLHILKVNEQVSIDLGYSQDELIGRSILDFDPLWSKKEFLGYLKSLKRERVVKIERVCVRKNGSQFPAEIKAKQFKTKNGLFFVAFIRDVSDRVNIEASLRAEKVLMDSFMENIPDSIFFKDRNCRLIKVSRKLMLDLGFQRMEQVLGKTDIDLFGSEFGQETMAIDRHVMDTGEPNIGRIEKRILANGEVNWTLVSKVPLTGDQGSIIGLVGVAREINAIKKREEEFKIKQNQLSIASEIAGLGYWEYNRDEDLISFNDHFFQIFETTYEKVGTYKLSPDEYFRRFLPPEAAPKLREELRLAMETSDPNYSRQLEHPILLPGGKIGYLLAHFFIEKDEEGKTTQLFGAIQNITERKLAENVIEESAAQLSVATQIAKLGYWEFDNNTGYITLNDQFYSLFQTSVEEVGGYKMTLEQYNKRFLFPEDSGLIGSETKLLEGSKGFEYHRYLEHRIKLPKGKAAYVAVRFVSLKNDKGKLIRSIGVCQDISDLKQAELALKESEISLKKAFEVALMGPLKYDIKKDRYIWTKETLNVLGFTEQNAPQCLQEYLNYFHPDDIPLFLKELQNADAIGFFDLEHRIIINGTQKWLRARAELELGTDGTPKNSIGIVQDITVQKQAEQELSNYRDDLEKLVKERTIQLENINKELEAFAYSISHDLRGPLRHINGFANLIRKKLEKVPDEVAQYVYFIHEASKRMGTMIDGLLHFSRLGRQQLEQVTIDLNKLIDNILIDVQPDISSREIHWVIGELPVIEGDYNLLKIAFENLIGNAIKYTRKREKARIEIAQCKKEGNDCTFYIKDNGVGFDMAYADKLFGVFQRLHGEEEFEGTGIGLANAQQIINKHGGRIRAEGMPGVGATFFITI